METQHKRSHNDDVAKIRWLHQFFRGKLLTSITRDQLSRHERKGIEASESTANRYMALMRASLQRARDEWEWIDKAPKVKMFREVRPRVRWITPGSARYADLRPAGDGHWKSGKMVRRCAHLGPAQMSRHADVVGGILKATILP